MSYTSNNSIGKSLVKDTGQSQFADIDHQKDCTIAYVFVISVISNNKKITVKFVKE